MKSLSVIAASAILFFCFTTACSKSTIEPARDEQPEHAETLPQYDNTSFGVYRGALMMSYMIDPSSPGNSGGSGNIKIMINNGNNIAKAYINVDNTIKDTLTCNETILPGQNIANALFTGRISSFRFNANADGTNPVLNNLLIALRGYISMVAHGSSTAPVEVYECRYVAIPASDENGIMNFIKKGDSLQCMQQCDYAASYRGTGVNSSTNFIINTSPFSFNGTLNNNGCSGTWKTFFLGLNGQPYRTGPFIGTKAM